MIEEKLNQKYENIRKAYEEVRKASFRFPYTPTNNLTSQSMVRRR